MLVASLQTLYLNIAEKFCPKKSDIVTGKMKYNVITYNLNHILGCINSNAAFQNVGEVIGNIIII